MVHFLFFYIHFHFAVGKKMLKKQFLGAKIQIFVKRCFQCECNKENRRNIFVPMLDAVIADKEVSVRITPQPSLEAIVNEKNVACYIMFNNEQ